jgi:hypothetical protein
MKAIQSLMILLLFCEGAAAVGQCVDTRQYSSYPLIVKAAISDIHESGFNGPAGFAYFAAAGKEKTGNLPPSLGGLNGWSTNVWASNFQGPWLVSGNARQQWEWTTDGWIQATIRTYPAVYCQQTATSAASFTLAAYTIKEDDDFLNGDDYVGKVQIDHRFCKSDVFDRGLLAGWSQQHTTAGIDDVKETSYKLYCSSQPACSITVRCPGVGLVGCSAPGSCAAGTCSAGPDYVTCGGEMRECASCRPGDPSCGS